MRYTCQTKSRTHGDCDGQTGYTVEKLDGMIDSIIHTIFAKVSSLSRDDIIAERFQYDRAARKAALDKAKKEYEKAESELKSLKGEIIKSISGESPFAPELLNSVIGEQESKCGELRKACILAQQELDDNDSALASMGQRYDDILEWSAVWTVCPMWKLPCARLHNFSANILAFNQGNILSVVGAYMIRLHDGGIENMIWESA